MFIDCSAMESEVDSLFHDKRRETLVEKSSVSFLNYIRNILPEKEIVVVGHSAWMVNASNAVVDCGDDGSLIVLVPHL